MPVNAVTKNLLTTNVSSKWDISYFASKVLDHRPG